MYNLLKSKHWKSLENHFGFILSLFSFIPILTLELLLLVLAEAYGAFAVSLS